MNYYFILNFKFNADSEGRKDSFKMFFSSLSQLDEWIYRLAYDFGIKYELLTVEMFCKKQNEKV